MRLIFPDYYFPDKIIKHFIQLLRRVHVMWRNADGGRMRMAEVYFGLVAARPTAP